MRAKIVYRDGTHHIIKEVTSFTAPKTDNFGYWTFWSTNEDDDKKVDIAFINVEEIKSISVIGGEVQDGSVS